MKSSMTKLKKAITRNTKAQIELSWRGAAALADRPAIDREARDADRYLKTSLLEAHNAGIDMFYHGVLLALEQLSQDGFKAGGREANGIIFAAGYSALARVARASLTAREANPDLLKWMQEQDSM